MIALCEGIFCRQWPICFWCHKKRPRRFFHPLLPNMSPVSLSFYVTACLIISSSGHSKYFTTNYKVFWRRNFVEKNRIAWYFLCARSLQTYQLLHQRNFVILDLDQLLFIFCNDFRFKEKLCISYRKVKLRKHVLLNKDCILYANQKYTKIWI